MLSQFIPITQMVIPIIFVYTTEKDRESLDKFKVCLDNNLDNNIFRQHDTIERSCERYIIVECHNGKYTIRIPGVNETGDSYKPVNYDDSYIRQCLDGYEDKDGDELHDILIDILLQIRDDYFHEELIQV